ncbi:hypothetical protein PG985_003205 [Apiospora marii]|uniref:uncharacterized protein n=1 Tax=Apiospora marii TaxID=335849 RepID=UPI0031323900
MFSEATDWIAASCGIFAVSLAGVTLYFVVRQSCSVARVRVVPDIPLVSVGVGGNNTPADQVPPATESGNESTTGPQATEDRGAPRPVSAENATGPTTDLTTSAIMVADGGDTVEASDQASPEHGSHALTGQTAEATETSRLQAPDDVPSGEALRSGSEQNIPEASVSSGIKPLTLL